MVPALSSDIVFEYEPTPEEAISTAASNNEQNFP
jgi:hypothetical protein